VTTSADTSPCLATRCVAAAGDDNMAVNDGTVYVYDLISHPRVCGNTSLVATLTTQHGSR